MLRGAIVKAHTFSLGGVGSCISHKPCRASYHKTQRVWSLFIKLVPANLKSPMSVGTSVVVRSTGSQIGSFMPQNTAPLEILEFFHLSTKYFYFSISSLMSNSWTQGIPGLEETLTGLSNLWNLMSDDLRWSWCSNNRNKVHSKCKVLKSSKTISRPHPQSGKNCLPWNRSLVPKSGGPLP